MEYFAHLLSHILPYYSILCHTIPYYAILFHTMSYYSINTDTPKFVLFFTTIDFAKVERSLRSLFDICYHFTVSCFYFFAVFLTSNNKSVQFFVLTSPKHDWTSRKLFNQLCNAYTACSAFSAYGTGIKLFKQLYNAYTACSAFSEYGTGINCN